MPRRDITSIDVKTMANRLDYATIEVPRILHDRLRMAKFHHRQSYAELLDALLDFWDDHYGWGPGHPPPNP